MKQIKLLPQFLNLIQQWRPCFADYRTHGRAVGFALSLLVCLGRRTISRAICAQQRQFQSWASDYKLFSLSRWSPRSLFDVVLKLALALVSKTQPVVIALDDTITRKTGHRIPNASTLRDPLSPAYHTNLVWALRFIQAVLLICPIDGIGAARAIPIAFNLAPPVPKPKKKKASNTTSADTNDKSDANVKKVGKKTTDPEWKQYYKMRRQQGLSAQGALLIQQIRSRLDAMADFAQRILWVVVDASYCNLTVLSRLPERTVLIGRTRKDIHLSALPEAQSGRGRRRSYGKDLGTPEQMRKDDSIPWQRASIFAAGRSHQLRYKSVGPVLWRRGAQRRPLRLIIIALWPITLTGIGSIATPLTCWSPIRLPIWFKCSKPTSIVGKSKSIRRTKKICSVSARLKSGPNKPSRTSLLFMSPLTPCFCWPPSNALA